MGDHLGTRGAAGMGENIDASQRGVNIVKSETLLVAILCQGLYQVEHH